MTLGDLDGRTNVAKAAKALIAVFESYLGGADLEVADLARNLRFGCEFRDVRQLAYLKRIVIPAWQPAAATAIGRVSADEFLQLIFRRNP